MRKYYKNWKRIFLGPPTEGGGGGSQGNPAASQAGGGADDGSSGGFQDPTAVLTDLDDLTPEIREIVEKSRAGFAALQNQLKQTAAEKIAEENRRKDFQSKFDRLQAQVQGINGGGQQQGQDPEAEQLQQFTDILIGEGVDPKFAPAQARILQKTVGKMGEALKAQIGKDLQPFASTIVSREAEFAWQQAVATDKTGALQNPEIAQAIWDKVQLMAQNGQQVNAGIVQNLTGMEVFARMQNGTFNPSTTPPPVQQQQQQQLPNVGRLTYPGAGNNTTRPVPFDPSAARTTLDPDTDAALQTVFREWNKGDGAVKAPGYRPPVTKGRR